MSAPILFRLACLKQTFQGILPNNFQHGEAYYASYWHLRLNKAGIYQGSKREDRLFRGHLSFGPANRLSRFERPTPYEDPQHAKTPLLFPREQFVTPGNSVLHRLLACWQVSCPTA